MRFFSIVQGFYAWIRGVPKGPHDIPLQNVSADGDSPADEPEASAGVVFTRMAHSNIGAASRGIKALWGLVFIIPVSLNTTRWQTWWSHIKVQKRKIGGQFVMVVFGLGLFAVDTTLAAFSGNFLTSDSLALSDSPKCGVWTRTGPLYSTAINLVTGLEREAGDYVKKCYNAPPGADGCHDYYKQSIPSSEIDHVDCPFGEEICPSPDIKALQVSTGLFPANYLGVNAPELFQLKRTTTCIPLNMNSSYVRMVRGDEGTLDWQYFYTHGGHKWTWQTSAPAWEPRSPSYSLAAIVALDTSSGTGWQPIPALAPQNSTATILLFIGSSRIWHLHPRTDPIFPTNSNNTLLGSTFGPEGLLVYRDRFIGLSRVFGCVDETLICNPSGLDCRSPEIALPMDDLPANKATRAGYWLTHFAARGLPFFDTIATQGADSLDARTKLTMSISQPLPAEQWKVEVRNIFNASLARMVLKAHHIARGVGAGEEGYIDLLDPAYSDPTMRSLCKSYKFYADGYTNLNVVYLVLTILLIMLVLASSIELESDDSVAVAAVKWSRKKAVFVYRFGVSLGRVLGSWMAGQVKIMWEMRTKRRAGRGPHANPATLGSAPPGAQRTWMQEIYRLFG